jgi:NAD(P)-dependent dehydrogenase (short-subunit alcohol dehydrogenase family)
MQMSILRGFPRMFAGVADERRRREPDASYLRELFDLSGRVALVTGARQGIGRAIALAYARAGADVAVTSRRAGDLEQVVGELAELGAGNMAMELDVRDESQIVRCVELVRSHFGRLDIVVNNAGLSVRKPAIETTAAEWDDVVEINLRGTFLVSREAARAMEHGGRIVNLSSTFATVAHPERAAYSASKAGVEQLTRVLALEWAPRGITVNAIAPTTIETESRKHVLADEDARRERIARIPLGRLSETDDLIGTALLLAGKGGEFITGQTILVDGGFTLGRS